MTQLAQTLRVRRGKLGNAQDQLLMCGSPEVARREPVIRVIAMIDHDDLGAAQQRRRACRSCAEAAPFTSAVNEFSSPLPSSAVYETPLSLSVRAKML